jgi:error-prone DNA polymerase
MQSAMAHAVAEIERVDGDRIDLEDEAQVPRDDPATFELIRTARTLGCFQIESPGQRELIGKFGPETFDDLIIDISLFRPGPVKSDMVNPFLRARHGWSMPDYLDERLEALLRPTSGVVVFHEQVIELIAALTACTLAEADEARRSLGHREAKDEVETWLFPRALAQGFPLPLVRRCWDVLAAFASFGFCKAHAAAFALPTYQSAWLKAHHPAAFLSGVLTHDPGMYPKRLILDDARQFAVAVLPLDVNSSDDVYRVERTAGTYGIRLSLTDVKGISDAEVARLMAARPFHSLSDLWHRARPSRPVAEHLVLAGGLDAVYGIGGPVTVRRRRTVTRRDLLLQVSELDRWTRATDKAVRASRPRRLAIPPATPIGSDPRESAAAQSQATAPVEPVAAVQLTLDLDDAPRLAEASGLPDMTGAERVRAELEILGLDVSQHVVGFYAPMLDELQVTRARDLLRQRSQAQLVVAGVKVATQTPPVRSGRRVVFVTVDDGTGPVDATFFDDAQGPYAVTLFHAWLLVIRGDLRRTGRRGVSLRATGCWELSVLYDVWQRQGIGAVHAFMRAEPVDPVRGEAEQHRVLVHPSGFKQSPYADVRPAGESTTSVPRRLWYRSPGSSG